MSDLALRAAHGSVSAFLNTYTFQWQDTVGPFENNLTPLGIMASYRGRAMLPRISVDTPRSLSGVYSLSLSWMYKDTVDFMVLCLQYWETSASASLLKEAPPSPSAGVATPVEQNSDPAEVLSDASQSPNASLTNATPIGTDRSITAALYDSNHQVLFPGAQKDVCLRDLLVRQANDAVRTSAAFGCDLPIKDGLYIRLRCSPSVTLDGTFGYVVEWTPNVKETITTTILRDIKIVCTIRQQL